MTKQSKRWKGCEREVARRFGGRRVPLSGRNSGHDTAADAMDSEEGEVEFPDFLYIETKRDNTLNKLFEHYHEVLHGGMIVAFALEDVYYVAFELDLFLEGKCVKVGNGEWTRAFNALHRIYCDAKVKAVHEDSTEAIVVCKLHGRRGYFVFTQWDALKRLEEWRKCQAKNLSMRH